MKKDLSQFDSSKILKNLTQKIDKTKFDHTQAPSGKIESVGDGIALVSGLHETGMGELVSFSGSIPGLALNLNEHLTGCVILGDPLSLKEGDLVKSTGQLLSVPVDNSMVGRVVSVLGEPLDGLGPIKSTKKNPLEKIAPGVISREPVNTPLQTGIKAIDAMIPIGRGQRELIIGDKSTGKTSIALTTIINQKEEDVICVYVAIGQKRSLISQNISILKQHNAMDHTIIVSASASDPAAQQYIAPYAGSAIAEHFLDQGKDVLIIYDDLTKHAWAYREISLLLRRPSGREAYPGDVFYLHSRLLERAVKLNKKHGGGSITALPIIETQANDVSAYIPTNVISITDGQIYLESDLFNAGQRPAVNVGLSVSRVGSSAQIKAMKQAAGKLRLELAQYRSLEAFTQFSSDLDPQTRAQIDRGARLTQLLKQHWEDPKTVVDQSVVIWAATNGFVDKVQLEHLQVWESEFLKLLSSKHSKLLESIIKEKQLTDKITDLLTKIASAFNEQNTQWLIQEEADSDKSTN